MPNTLGVAPETDLPAAAVFLGGSWMATASNKNPERESSAWD